MVSDNQIVEKPMVKEETLPPIVKDDILPPIVQEVV